METYIRSYIKSDLPVLTELFNKIVLEGDSFLTKEPISILEMETRLDNEELATYVIDLGKETPLIVGFYMLRTNLKGRGNHIANATYLVEKEYRGNGFGKRLGEHSLKIAQKMGFKGMQFNSVVVRNKASINLWKGLGFEIKTTIEDGFQLSDNKYCDILIMYKKLKNELNNLHNA